MHDYPQTTNMPGEGRCRYTNCRRKGFMVSASPYDVISGSPILSPSYLCLDHYNENVLAALAYIERKLIDK